MSFQMVSWKKGKRTAEGLNLVSDELIRKPCRIKITRNVNLHVVCGCHDARAFQVARTARKGRAKRRQTPWELG